MHVIPGRGCVCGVVGPNVEGLPFFWMPRVASGSAWDGVPEWVRVPYAKAARWCFVGVPE